MGVGGNLGRRAPLSMQNHFTKICNRPRWPPALQEQHNNEVMGSNLVVHAGDAIPDGESHVMTEIPQSAIEARNKMYTKNEYMPNSF